MWNYKVSKINNDKLGKITWLNNFCLTEKAACLKTVMSRAGLLENFASRFQVSAFAVKLS